MKKETKVDWNFKPRINGSQIINIICARCHKVFSERNGHRCKDDRRY
jgi:hypothetical protein